MSTFEERERAFEAKFAHDEELRFRTHARRDRLLGLWAGEKLGHRGEALEAYAMSLVVSELGRDGEVAVKKKLEADFAHAGLVVTADEIAAAMSRCLAEAMRTLVTSM